MMEQLTIVDESGAVEPLTLDEAKLQVRLPVSTAHPEDTLIGSILVPAVRQRCEVATNRQLRAVTYDYLAPCFPPIRIYLPRPPLLEVVSVQYVDAGGMLRTLAEGTHYVVSVPSGEKAARGFLEPVWGGIWPATRAQWDAVRVRFRCGYGADDGPAVPALLKQAMLLDLAMLYRNREAVVTDQGVTVAELPMGTRAIYWSYRVHG